MRFGLLVLFTTSGLSLAAAGPDLPSLPLPVPQELSAATRRAQKPAVDTRLLDDMEAIETWALSGPGRMSLTTDRARDGRHSLRLTSPTRLDQPGPVLGRPFAETGARRKVAGEDWTDFNRISFQVFPRLPGFRTISLLVKFHAAGDDRWPYTFGHLHYVLLRPDTWNHVVWEIPHLPRTNVTGIELVYRLQGNEPGATETVQFDFDDLRLERVEEPDAYLGWEVPPGQIAYCHLGYEPGTRKIAITAPTPPKTSAQPTAFELRPAAGGPVAFRGQARAFDENGIRAEILDFTAFDTAGDYVLSTSTGIRTGPFPIRSGIWLPAVVATLNHYYCQRCGDPVPGIHDVCHRDWQVAHGSRRLPINGGWHDAGDLSQGLVNTSEATAALAAAADLLGQPAPLLAKRLLVEARWGLDWMLRTRFGDGFRATWATMDFWTDGVPGNADDATARAGDSAFDNLIACAATARAARALTTVDPAAAASAIRAAEEDWTFALKKLGTPRTDLAAAAVNAAVELHRVTKRNEFRDRAIEIGEALLSAQQRETPADWPLPLAGYFQTSPEGKRPLRYEHRGHNEGPIVALVTLCRTFPGHPRAAAWRSAVAAHANYLKTSARAAGPWQMPAAGIYSLREGDERFQRQVREGMRLDADHYLRRFPVWGEMRGNSGILLSQARAMTAAAGLLADRELAQLARTQLEWHFGRNPFCQSLMYGIGRNFTPQYTAMSGDITGGLPVGIQTRLDEDIPYWPASNCYNYSEIWVHPSSRFLATWTDLAALDADAP